MAVTELGVHASIFRMQPSFQEMPAEGFADVSADTKNVACRRLVDRQSAIFEKGGIQFIPENGGGLGIRFRDRNDAQ